jgi:hypothetical protein
MSIIFVITTAYTGYRRSIGDILESSSDTTAHKNKVVEVENHNNNKITSSATIITQNTENNATLPSSTSSSSAGTLQKDSPNSNEAFIQNEKQAQVQAPQPAPRTRLSSQNSIPLTNGTTTTTKSDDAAQVRYECFSSLVIGMFSASRYNRKEILF